MAEALEAAPPVSHDEASWRCEQLTMLVCRPPAMFHLEGGRDGATDAMLPAAGCCTADVTGRLFSIAPDVYFFVGGGSNAGALNARFQVVIDVSSAWTHLAFAGPRVVELLRKGCAVDLHPRAFPAGACCATGFARMRVVLWRPSIEARYEMLVARSYARTLWSWLIEAAEQYRGQKTEEPLQ